MIGKMTGLQKTVDDVINSIANQCLEAVLESALSKLPVETELQAKVRAKEREDFENAMQDVVRSAGFEVGAFNGTWESLGIEMNPQPEIDEDEEEAQTFPPATMAMLEQVH